MLERIDVLGGERTAIMLPSRVKAQLRLQCAETGKTLRRLILEALREAGYTMDDDDLVDGRTARWQKIKETERKHQEWVAKQRARASTAAPSHDDDII